MWRSHHHHDRPAVMLSRKKKFRHWYWLRSFDLIYLNWLLCMNSLEIKNNPTVSLAMDSISAPKRKKREISLFCVQGAKTKRMKKEEKAKKRTSSSFSSFIPFFLRSIFGGPPPPKIRIHPFSFFCTPETCILNFANFLQKATFFFSCPKRSLNLFPPFSNRIISRWISAQIERRTSIGVSMVPFLQAAVTEPSKSNEFSPSLPFFPLLLSLTHSG